MNETTQQTDFSKAVINLWNGSKIVIFGFPKGVSTLTMNTVVENEPRGPKDVVLCAKAGAEKPTRIDIDENRHITMHLSEQYEAGTPQETIDAYLKEVRAIVKDPSITIV